MRSRGGLRRWRRKSLLRGSRFERLQGLVMGCEMGRGVEFISKCSKIVYWRRMRVVLQ